MAVAAACSLFAGCSSGDDRVCASVQLGYPVFSDAESSRSLNSNVSDLLLDGFGSVDSLCNTFFGQWAGYRETVFSDTLGHAHVDMSHDQEEDEYFPEVWYYSRTADVCGHGRGFVSLMFRTATNGFWLLRTFFPILRPSGVLSAASLCGATGSARVFRSRNRE